VISDSGTYTQLIGWPLLGILHLILLGPMAELASAYPVTGAMATWSWQLARHGVGHPREWGWLVNGFVLAGHLGKVRLTS
jgi:amino acid permease